MSYRCNDGKLSVIKILALLLLYACHAIAVEVRGDSIVIHVDAEFCKYSQTTRRIVKTCPSDERSWKEAASKMKCSNRSGKCAGEMVYHCLINPWQNLTVEVCAPATRIRAGYCAEYNRRGGKIQEFYSQTCKGCTRDYQSTEAYKYQECYEKVYQLTQKRKQPRQEQEITVFMSFEDGETWINEGQKTGRKDQNIMFDEIQNSSNRNKLNLKHHSVVIVLLVMLSL